MDVMLAWIIGVGLVGALLVLAVAVPAVRRGRATQTWWSRRRAERTARAARRPIPSAFERARESRLRRARRAATDLVTRRRVADPVATPVVAAQTHQAADGLVCAADRQAQAASRGEAAVDTLASTGRDEVAARRRAAQQRIAAEAANTMALSVPGRLDESWIEDGLDDVDLPRASGGH